MPRISAGFPRWQKLSLILICALGLTALGGWLYPQSIRAAPPQGSRNGMVVTEQHLASEVGRQILQAGGNAVDAAVAIGYALAVTHPCCGNLGGGGFMLIHPAQGEDVFLNFRERAPQAADRDLYLDPQGHVIPKLSSEGYLAVAVPGTVLGLETALQRYGTMTRQQVI